VEEETEAVVSEPSSELPTPPIRRPHRHIGFSDPKLRHGSYFPDWLLERRQRAERALTTVVATSYLLGVSTRRMDKLIETLGITSLSKSEVSVTAKELDTAVEAFRSCPLDASPGSGKSMAYIVPIIDRVAWEGSDHGVRPVVAYR
jgi:Transposase, Mutator family